MQAATELPQPEPILHITEQRVSEEIQILSKETKALEKSELALFKIKPVWMQEEDRRFDEYISFLKGYGALVSEKLDCGIFHLKNGLPYSGLYAKEEINPRFKQNNGKEEILVTIPVEMLLTSYKAENLADEELKVVLKKFYHEGPICEDRILVTYLLYNLDKNKENLWSKMASYFSKDIDIISFWEKRDLALFLDSSVEKAAQMERKNFEKEWSQFQEIQQKSVILQGPTFTYENYKWIYVHAISRCFGSYMNSTYFTPFCEFFNHNCVDVSYYCLLEEEYTQKRISEKHSEEEKISEAEEDGMSDVSSCSGDSEDYIEEGDFAYDEVPSYTIKWNSKVSFKLKPKETKIIEDLQKKVKLFLDSEIQWKGVGLMYIGEILEKVNLIGSEYMAERKKFAQAKEELELLIYHVSQFKKSMKKYYLTMGVTYNKKKNISSLNVQDAELKPENPNEEVEVVEENNYIKTHKPPSKPYKYFTMVCHETQNYEKNQEVYFEYGRLSNRTLLLRYGFCLENNKYEHVWIRRKIYKEIGQYPDLFEGIRDRGVPVVIKIKLKPYVINTELVILEKVEKWKMYGSVGQNSSRDFEKMFGITDIHAELEIIDKVIEIYREELTKYMYKESNCEPSFYTKIKDRIDGQGLIDLTNQELGYHEYFAAVYNNEKIKILNQQILMYQKTRLIFEEVIRRGVVLKGNKDLLIEIKEIGLEVIKSREGLRMVWGYVKTLFASIMSE